MHGDQGVTGRQEGTLSRGLGYVRAEGCQGLGASWESGVVPGGWTLVQVQGVWREKESNLEKEAEDSGSSLQAVGGCNQGGEL